MGPDRPIIHVAPASGRDQFGGAVEAGGGVLAGADAASALVWTAPADPDGLTTLLADHPELDWVQLPWAGIEPYRDILDDQRRWTSGKGVYAEPVAEHALALLLGGLRGVVRYARADHWSDQYGTSLVGAPVTIVGGGGIAEVLLRLLAPFDARVTVVRRHPRPMKGAAEVVAADQLDDVLPGAVGVVLALPVLPDTTGLIGAAQLAAMDTRAWLINVARGAHVDTDALVEALHAGSIGGAGLDVTDPEPLPAGHPLWSAPNCVITPHIGNTAEMAFPLLSARITENVRRYAAGEPLLGPVDPALGY